MIARATKLEIFATNDTIVIDLDRIESITAQANPKRTVVCMHSGACYATSIDAEALRHHWMEGRTLRAVTATNV